MSLPSGKEIAAVKRLFSKEKNEVTGRRFEMYQTDSVRNRAKLYEVHAWGRLAGSVKYKRKFVGLAVRINGRIYVVPLTSQTTKERVARGKKKCRDYYFYKN